MNQTKTLIILPLLLITLAACNPSSAGPPPTAQKEVEDAAALTPPTPTPTVTPSPMPEPSPTPTDPPPPIPARLKPMLEQPVDGLEVYQPAMRPEFWGDVDTVAQSGASRYTIEARLDPQTFDNEDGLMLEGLERVQYTNTETVALEEIYFRLYPNLPAYNGDMDIKTVVVNGRVVEPELQAENTALRVPLMQPLAPGESIDISLMYTLLIPTEPEFGYNIFVYTDDTITLAGFYPAVAVYDESGWDTGIPPYYGDAPYLDVALYQVQLTVPQEMVVTASGSEVGRQKNNDGTQTLSLVSGPIREFYIAMGLDYEVASETVDGIVVNSHYPGQVEEGGQQALRNAADALRVYNQAFGPYPYAEFDIVATPTTAGGIEYAGIVAINQQLYEFPGMFFQQAIAHEVAHQWWYNVVGNHQVEEPWLDESLTNYSTVLYWEAVAGEEEVAQVIDGYFLGPYKKAQETNQDRPVVGPVSDFSERDYGIIVYGKGPLFFEALREKVGDETYLDILQTYYQQYKYQIATGEELLNVIETVSGRKIDPLFEQWMESPE